MPVIVLRPDLGRDYRPRDPGVSRRVPEGSIKAEVWPVRWYADAPGRRARQLAGDLLAVGWVALWVWVALEVRERVDALAAPGREVQDAGNQLSASLREAEEQVASLPLVGRALQDPLEAAGSAARALAEAGAAQRAAVADLALFLTVALVALPLALVALAWLPRRARWSCQASAAARLAAAPEGSRLLALRALTGSDLSALARASHEPVLRDPAVLVC